MDDSAADFVFFPLVMYFSDPKTSYAGPGQGEDGRKEAFRGWSLFVVTGLPSIINWCAAGIAGGETRRSARNTLSPVVG